MKKLLIVFVAILLFFLPLPVFANSSYVLPYPSVMPGGLNYKLHVIFERLQKFWYFGDFGQYMYNLKEADKYLVEAKTLFEYQQYLLGYKALVQSDQFFISTSPNLTRAKENGKNIEAKKNELKVACDKHEEVLSLLLLEIPSAFVWQPEKASSVTLNLHKTINESISIRKKTCNNL